VAARIERGGGGGVLPLWLSLNSELVHANYVAKEGL